MWQWSVGLVALVLGAAAALLFAQDDPSLRPPVLPSGQHEVIILHTNDLHGHVYPWRGWDGDLLNREVGGVATLASAVKRIRAQVPGGRVLLLDAGDATGDTYLAQKTQGKAMLAPMDQLGYSATVLGNNDSDFATQTLLDRHKQYRMEFLAANVVRDDTREPVTRPYLIEKVGDIRLGILGLAYPYIPDTTPTERFRSLRFNTDSSAVVREYLPRMYRDGAQVIVVLSQLGLEADRRLAQDVPAISVIMGGHSHNRISEAQKIGKTVIVQAGAHGSDLGRLDLVFRNGALDSVRHQLIPLYTETYSPDPQVAAMINRFAAPYEADMSQTLARATAPIVRPQTFALEEPQLQTDPSPADMLFADLLRERTASDVAILPSVTYGTAVLPGPITVRDLHNLVPGDVEVVTMNLTGDQIRGVLEQSIYNAYVDDPTQRLGGLVQVSGVTYSYDPTSVKGMAVKEMTIAGRPADLSATYRVATTSTLGVGGYRYANFTSGKNVQRHGLLVDVVADALRAKREVAPPTDARVTLVRR